MNRRTTEDQKQRIFDLRQEGRPVGWIARKLAMPIGTVRYWVLSLGATSAKDRAAPPPSLAPMKRGNHEVRRFGSAEDAELIRLSQGERLRTVEVARRLGRKPNSIKCRLLTLAYQAEQHEGGESISNTPAPSARPAVE